MVSSVAIFKANIRDYNDYLGRTTKVPNFRERGTQFILTQKELFLHYLNNAIKLAEIYQLFPSLRAEFLKQFAALTNSEMQSILPSIDRISTLLNATKSSELHDFFATKFLSDKSFFKHYIQDPSQFPKLCNLFPEKFQSYDQVVQEHQGQSQFWSRSVVKVRPSSRESSNVPQGRMGSN